MTAKFLTPGQFLNPTRGVTFYMADLTPEGVLRGVFLTDARREDRRTTYIAREAFLVDHEAGPKLVMVEGQAQVLSTVDRRLAVTRFDDFAFDIGRLITAARPPRPTPRDFSTPQLLRADPALLASVDSTRARFQWEAHNRFTQSLLGLIAPLIGLGTLLIGAFSRFGIWRQILAAIAILIVLKLIDNSASSAARSIDGGWPVQYAAIVIGAAVSWALLTYAGRTRRRPPHGGESLA